MSDKPLVIDILTPLTTEETARRDILDREMDDREGHVVEYFRALMEYREKKLWKGIYPSFEAYLANRRKKIGRGRASQLIQYVRVIDMLKSQPGVDLLPENERQTRELKGIADPAKAAAAWLAAQLASGQEQPSNTWIKSAVETLEQAEVKDGMVQGENSAEIPATVTSVIQQTANIELERVQRMIDHIRANRKTKPVAVFEAVFECSYLEDEDDEAQDRANPYTALLRLPEDLKALTQDTHYRFVIYAMPEVQKEAQP